MKSRKSFLIVEWGVILLMVFAPDSFAGIYRAYEPESFIRTMGPPIAVTNTFTVLNANNTCTLRIHNGGLEDSEYERVTSSLIILNGVQVVGPSEFNQNVALIEKPVTINLNNTLSVEARGKPGGAIIAEVSCVDDNQPTITATIDPQPNAAGWNNTDVTVYFTCSDILSGISMCPDPVNLTASGENQIVTGTAADNAGNSATVSVSINIDKTPPSVTRSWPPDDNFGTDRNTVEVVGTLTDDLSGVIEAEIRDNLGIASLQIPAFAVSRPLQTDIVPGELWRTNLFEIEAVDRAGNSGQETFSVRYTMGPTVSLTDPSRTELVGDLLTSVNRLIVRFHTSVSRDSIHEVIREEGGRVAGFLPAGNMALAEFETEHVVDLENIVDSLKTRSEVDVATLAIFPPSLSTFDNDLLLATERAAYDNIKSSLASNFIINEGFPLNPVNIAIIDTGMDDTHGRNSEFGGVNFFDLCTPEGQQGQIGTPIDLNDPPTYAHGTKITGIVAGANNGEGNNGVLRGIAGSQFGVNVFRMNCNGSNDPFLTADALDLIISGTVGDINVVNMSFGYFAGPSVGDIYKGYFDSIAGREILWIAGAGNNDQEIGCNEFFPSGLACDLDNVVSVGAYNPGDLNRGRWISSSGQQFGSNFGDGITLSAPGTDVWTATDPGEYGGVSGTSASAPLVAGAAAMMLAVNPLSPDTVKQLMIDTTQPLNDANLPEGGLDILALLLQGWSYGYVCPCFTGADLNAVEWDIWCSLSGEYLLDNAVSSDPGPLFGAGIGGGGSVCWTGSFYNTVEHSITEAEAQACIALIFLTGTNQGTERACRID